MSADLSQMIEAFEEAGLGLPPIPVPFQEGLYNVAEWSWATAEIDPVAMYMFAEYPAEELASPGDDYVAVSHWGHGMNSYALTYHLVYGSLVIFTQTLFGGVYQDDSAVAADVSNMFEQCGRLIDAFQRRPRPRFEPRGRLFVLDSPFRGVSFAGWLPTTFNGDTSDARQWLALASQGPFSLADALLAQSDALPTEGTLDDSL